MYVHVPYPLRLSPQTDGAVIRQDTVYMYTAIWGIDVHCNLASMHPLQKLVKWIIILTEGACSGDYSM